jgi:hypothetical protein
MPSLSLDVPEFCGNGHDLSNHLKFRKDNRAPKGFRWACTACDRIYRIAHRFGISLEQLEEMLVEQDNKCAICEKQFGESTKDKPYIDHDHSCCAGNVSCGKCIRGIICMKCNTMLGMAEDNVSTLTNAITYLGGRHA